jgi:hypothetical protein
VRPFAVNGIEWEVVRVNPGDPRLIDRTGAEKLATTDPSTRTVHISSEVGPPLLDRVALHEAAHVVAVSHGMIPPIRAVVPAAFWVPVEEWAAQTMELHGLEAADVASRMLGRPVCVGGFCR